MILNNTFRPSGDKFYTQLIIEYFLNPVTLVHTVNKSIDFTHEEEMRRMQQNGPQKSPGGDFYRRSKLMPLTMVDEPQNSQMLFIQAAVIILKDQWKSYLKHTINEQEEDSIVFSFFGNLHKYFKVLLVERPNLIRGKLLNIGCIFLSMITPDDLDLVTAFDEFISMEKEVVSKKSKSQTPTFFESLTNFRTSATNSINIQPHQLTLEKVHKNGKMDSESFTAWIKTFLVFYTDTVRDFVTYMAEEDSRTALDYLFIYELSELYAEESGFIIKEWVQLERLTQIARGLRNEEKYTLHCIYMLQANPEWIDPFSYDLYFNKKLHIFIDSMTHKLPSVASLPKEMHKESSEELIKFISDISVPLQNFISLARWCRVDSQEFSNFNIRQR